MTDKSELVADAPSSATEAADDLCQLQEALGIAAARLAGLEIFLQAVRRNGKLSFVHLRSWKKSIEDKQGYESTLTAWLGEVADALEVLDAQPRT